MRRAPSRASSSRLIVSSLRAASSVTTLNMSRCSFLAGGGAPASFRFGQGGRYAAFSCQGLIHRFRRYLCAGTSSGSGTGDVLGHLVAELEGGPVMIVGG